MRFNHLLTERDVRSTLRCVREHLDEGGSFLVENTVPDVEEMVRSNGKEKEFEFTHPVSGRTILHRVTARYDFCGQLEHAHILTEEHEGGGMLRQAGCRTVTTYFFPRELRSLLTSSGLRVVYEWGSFDEEPISENSRRMIFVCKPA